MSKSKWHSKGGRSPGSRRPDFPGEGGFPRGSPTLPRGTLLGSAARAWGRHRFRRVCKARDRSSPGSGAAMLRQRQTVRAAAAQCDADVRAGPPCAGSPEGAQARRPPQCASPRGRRESRPRHSPEGSEGAGPPGRLRRSPPARAPAPTCPCGPGECGSQSREASRVPARRRRLSAHYVMPRHAPAQPTGARAPRNVNTARTWLARPGHVRGGPGRAAALWGAPKTRARCLEGQRVSSQRRTRGA